ncbi:CarD family transcriptional regulator [Sinanaerobacter sp. ZZT-01]|uniref:CarD family transcriptional regulator n=1 Tax=Sinanaerobacter sp. ZZT-01 TaxID=3111540 RepID=UPI002D7A0DA5|nr:CarD family transcriptional regulator [Sinanaerobacter sp. ZZT-01]WRR95015.1 CarD family transcriptional regulator [Sinanaerobacter sp. ZZT-01]
MFTIGEKIVYPMHGAGVIETIEEKKILGESRRYYILKLSCSDIKIMIPVDATDEIGVRAVVSEEKLSCVFEILNSKSSVMSTNWNRRYRENMEKLKTGEIEEVAEVVRDLTRCERDKKLSTGEKKMLINANQILVSEIILVKEIDRDAATAIVDAAV